MNRPPSGPNNPSSTIFTPTSTAPGVSPCTGNGVTYYAPSSSCIINSIPSCRNNTLPLNTPSGLECQLNSKPKCTIGLTWNSTLNKCATTNNTIPCPGGKYDAATSTCVLIAPPLCPPSSTYNKTVNNCVKDPIKTTCPAGVPGSNVCLSSTPCDNGSIFNSSLNKCVSTPSPTCPPNSQWNNTKKSCVNGPPPPCPNLTVWSPSATQCIATTSTPSPTCGSGNMFSNNLNKCVTTTIPKCPSGFKLTNNMCMSNSNSTNPQCPSGKTLNKTSGLCI
jgi:hypothetical protein